MSTRAYYLLRLAVFSTGLVFIFSQFAISTRAQDAQLTLSKAADPLAYSAVSQTITYTFTVQNTGTLPLAGPVLVDDDKAANEFCPAVNTVGNTDDNLDPGEEIECSASYAITQADLDAGSVTNTATATAGGTTSNAATATVDADQSPALTVAISADPGNFNSVGQVISYSYEITNSGNVTLEEPFAIIDDKADNESCPSAPSLAPGDSIICEAFYSITQADLNAGSVTNTANATGKFGPDTITSANAEKTINANQDQQLALDKETTTAAYDSPDDSIAYTYTLTNSGNVVLDGPFSVADDKVTVSCPSTTSLNPGNSIDCTASYNVNQADLDNGFVTNTAQGQAFFGGDPVASSQDSVTVNAVQTPELTLVKSAEPDTYNSLDDEIAYSYGLTNTGNVTLSGPFSVTDDKVTVSCTSPPPSLAPGDAVTCSASYAITQADLNNGSVTNTAEGHASFDGNPVDSNQDSATVTAQQIKTLSLTKTADEASYNSVGDILNYTLVAANTGNVTLQDVTISDPKLGALDCNPDQPVNRAPGAALTCTGDYTITQADLTNKNVMNLATASADNLTTPVQASETVFSSTFTISHIEILTSEDQAAPPATFTIKLDRQPSQNVTIQLSSSNTNEGIITSPSPPTLTFTPSNYSTPQPVTVKGVDDQVADDNQVFFIITSPVGGSDPFYQGVNPPDVQVTNVDNDAPGITAFAPNGLTVTEGMISRPLQVRLNTQPNVNVKLNIGISDNRPNNVEATVSPTSLVFTPANWNITQALTVTGVDDTEDDGDQGFQVNFTTETDDNKYRNETGSIAGLNRDAPTITWVLPVGNFQTYEIDDVRPILLKVQKLGQEPVSQVVFRRWDPVLEQYKEIGFDTTAPYQVTLYPGREPTRLVDGFNQIFAYARFGNSAESNLNLYIWIYKGRLLYLPAVIRMP